MAVKISFNNIKGGVGKTTSAVSVAGEFAQRNFKTLLIDMDPQGNASSNLGIDRANATVGNVLLGLSKAEESIIETSIDNLYILPSNLSLLRVEKQLLTNLDSRPDTKLAKGLNSIEHLFDFIIIDCSPYDNILVTNALTFTDYVIVPIKLDKNSLEGYDYLLEKINTIKESNPQLDILGILATMKRPTKLHDDILEGLKESRFKDLLFNTVIRININVEEAPFMNLPITKYMPSSSCGQDYKNVVDEIIVRIKGGK